MPRGVRAIMHSGVSSITLLRDVNQEILARPERTGVDEICGWPGRTETRQISLDYPPQIEHLYTHAQWTTFLTSLNTTLTATHVPACPLLLGSMCFPPLCCFWYYLRSSRSRTRIESFRELMSEENSRIVRSGLGWSEPLFIAKPHCGDMCIRSQPELRGTIQLQMELNARTQFELDHPQAPQYLANLLLQRTETQLAAATTTGVHTKDDSSGIATTPSASTMAVTCVSPTPMDTGGTAPRPPLSHTKSIELDASQKRLVHRQSMIRRTSATSTSRALSGAPIPMDYSPMTRTSIVRVTSLDARWAEPTSRQSTVSSRTSPFQPILISGPTNEVMI